jgi:hypothetical protein
MGGTIRAALADPLFSLKKEQTIYSLAFNKTWIIAEIHFGL